MSEFKKVPRSHLENFRFLIKTCSNRKMLLEYFDKHIFEIEKEQINGLKKMIYTMMTRYKEIDENKSREYYILYQNIKKGFIDYKTALNKFMEM